MSRLNFFRRALWQRIFLVRLPLALLLAVSAKAATDHPILALGSAAPDFSLPGVDGKTHRLAEYATSPVLVVVFTCNHCPIAQMYEQRIQQLDTDYRNRGVALVAIQGNDPKALRIDELDSSDMSDTLDEMKVRVEYKKLHYTYLYDGDTQSVTRAYGPKATPHIFIFDRDRKLSYEGRIDNSYRMEMVNTQDARNAIDALLANREVPVKHTGVFGCSTKWQEKSAERIAALHKIEQRAITVEMATAEDLKRLRENPSRKMTLISFWATWCGSCIDEFADLEETYLMYQVRDFDLVTVAANMPDEKAGVLKMLEKKRATSRNFLFASDDTAALQAAFDPTWQSAVPYTVLLDSDGTVLYKNMGSVDILELRRTILAALPSDYIGFNKYWQAGLAENEHAQKEHAKTGGQ
jgi:peroxiredoxin